MTREAWILLIGIALGLLGGWLLWVSEPTPDPSAKPRAEVRLAPDRVMPERVPVERVKPSGKVPAGGKVTDRGTATISHPDCAKPVEIVCEVVKERDGSTGLILEVPGGEVLDSRHEHEVQPGPARARPWRVLALGVYDPAADEWKPGVAVGRDAGPFALEAGAAPGMAWVGAGLRF